MTESININGLGCEVLIFQSMKQLYDKHDNEMSIHYRMRDGKFEIIVNRSCQECKEFGFIPKINGDKIWLCKKCTYSKDWLRLGLR